MKLNWLEARHMQLRFLRYKYRSEWPAIRFLHNYAKEGMTMCDVGANRGIWSYFMSHAAGRNGSVFAFEPQPELFPHLEALKRTFKLENLVLCNKGLSSSSGQVNMSRKYPGWGGARIGGSEFNKREVIEIEVGTLDGYFATLPESRVDLIKCDVEGHEIDVFKGGEELLKRDQPAIVFEQHTREAEDGGAFNFLVELGYDGFFLQVDPQDHNRIIPKRRGRWIHYKEWSRHPYLKPTISHRNYVFLKKGESPARSARLQHQ